MKNSRGFTLIELAIVLTIIGLIAGGILAGQSLIRGSETQAIISEIESIANAMKSFKDKYKSLPGDMPNATSFWPEVSAGCTAAAGTPQQTCNGNGDERIAEYNASQDYEEFRLWQHLALSGMYTGSFTGVSGPNDTFDTLPGTNIPVSKNGSVAYSAYFVSQTTASSAAAGTFAGASFYNKECGNCIILGKLKSPFVNYANNRNYANYAAAISGSQAYSIDLKSDDGDATKGNITSTYLPAAGLCLSGGVYLKTDDIKCTLHIKTGL